MKFAGKILQHTQFHKYLELNAKNEKKREFCCHDLQHALDVARVAYIISLEKGYNLDKDMIYSAALLHDIAKWKQYRDNVDHAEEGAILAGEILKDIGMEQQTADMILDAIRSHRFKIENGSTLSEVLYTGDKSCRVCPLCENIQVCRRFKDGQPPVLKY